MTAVHKPNRAEIMAAQTPAGGWTRAQLAEWGVAWPPLKGWKAKLIAEEREIRATPKQRAGIAA